MASGKLASHFLAPVRARRGGGGAPRQPAGERTADGAVELAGPEGLHQLLVVIGPRWATVADVAYLAHDFGTPHGLGLGPGQRATHDDPSQVRVKNSLRSSDTRPGSSCCEDRRRGRLGFTRPC